MAITVPATHRLPSIVALMVLPGVGDGVGAGVAVNVTLNAPFVTTLEPVAPLPGIASALNENVPVALVEVRVANMTTPLLASHSPELVVMVALAIPGCGIR